MDIRQLQYLVALAREKHFTRAAHACHVSQPTLSGRIRQLEQELGVPIVERGQRFHGFTPDGERVLKWAHTILDNWSALQRDIASRRNLSGSLSGRLSLGVIPSALPMAALITKAIQSRHPDVVCAPHTPATGRDLLTHRPHQSHYRNKRLDRNECLSDAAAMRLSRAMRAACTTIATIGITMSVAAAQGTAQAGTSSQSGNAATAADEGTFKLGETVYVLGKDPNRPGIAGAVVTHEQLQTFERNSLDQAVNLVPGVVSTFDANGRRNESDIFVRGFGRQQVPLMIDGVRVYLPADNRLDFARFLTADIAAIHVQKGYASVLDGPGAMGGAINLVTMQPTKRFEAEGGVSTGGRGVEGWNGYAIVGSRQPRYYVQSSVAVSDRDSWSLSSDYQQTPNSLQGSGERLGSDTQDWRANVKFGYTPNATNEYTFNYSKQSGEKGAPLNVHNNPPVPPNSFWRWPWWDVQNTSVLTTTRLGSASYVKAKGYYNTFSNALDAFDDITYSSQSAAGRFHSPYDDHAYGTSVEFGTTPVASDTLNAAFHHRTDVHAEQQTSRPTHPTLSSAEPEQEQAQYTWSIALENTFRLTPAMDVVGGVSYDKYSITMAEEFTAAAGSFEYPKGGADAVNWQAALQWRHPASGEWHASISDRSRFPVIFELYSTRFGTATPNPDLGPERATNLEVGWSREWSGAARLGAAVFYSDVRDLIQTVVLLDTTTQTQNVGRGDFAGVELSFDAAVGTRVRTGGHYTLVHRDITDALQPNLRPTGVPTNRAFLYATWQPTASVRITPSLDAAGDRWSDVNPVPAFPYVKTGAYALLDLDMTYAVAQTLSASRRAFEVSLGFKNLLDDHYELAWGYPQPGRTFYLKVRTKF